MSKRSTWGRRYSAKLGAAIIVAAMAVTSFSGVMPGGVAYAEENVTEEDDLILPKNRSVIWLAARQIGKCEFVNASLSIKNKSDLSSCQDKNILIY